MSNRWQTLLQAPELSVEALSQAFKLAALEQTAHIAAVTPDPHDPLRMHVRTRKGHMFLDPLHALYADLKHYRPSARARCMSSYLRATLEGVSAADGDLPAPTREQVVPMIKNLDWVAASQQPDLVAEPIAADVCMVIAFDHEETLRYPAAAELEQLGLRGKALRDTAVANLRTRLPHRLNALGDGLSYILYIGGTFEASLILIDEVWEQMGAAIPRDIVVAVPTRSCCLATSSGIEGGIERLRAARDYHFADGIPPHFISTELLRRVDGGWEAFPSG